MLCPKCAFSRLPQAVHWKEPSLPVGHRAEGIILFSALAYFAALVATAVLGAARTLDSRLRYIESRLLASDSHIRRFQRRIAKSCASKPIEKNQLSITRAEMTGKVVAVKLKKTKQSAVQILSPTIERPALPQPWSSGLSSAT